MKLQRTLLLLLLSLFTFSLLLGCGGGTNFGVPGDFNTTLPRYSIKGYIYKVPIPTRGKKALSYKYIFSPTQLDPSLYPDFQPAGGLQINMPDGSWTMTDTNGYFQLDNLNLNDLWDLVGTIFDGSN